MKARMFILIVLMLLFIPIVYAAAPTHDTPILNSTLGTNTTAENLTVYNISTADADGNPVKNIYQWYVNSGTFAQLNMPFEANSSTTYLVDYADSSRDYVIQAGVVYNATEGFDGNGTYTFNGLPGRAIRVKSFDATGDSGQQLTLSTWVKPLTNSAGGTVISHSDFSTTDRGYGILVLPNYSIRVILSEDGGITNYKQIETSTLIPFDAWTHIAVTWKSDGVNSGDCDIYFNGVNESNKRALINGQVRWLKYSNERPVVIGSQLSNNVSVNVFNGSIDEVLIFNKTLTPQQIKAIYDNMTNTIVSQELVVGQVWNASVTPNDGTSNGITKFSNNLTINTVPQVETPVFNVTTVTKTSGLKANTTYNDLDSDAGTIYFAWYRNDTEIYTDNQTSIAAGTVVYSTLNSALYNKGDLLNVTVYANDGIINSVLNYSTTLTVANTVPTQNLPVLNSTLGYNNSDENLTVYNISTFDVDVDAVKNIYAWYRNDIPYMVLNLPFEGGSSSTFVKDYSGFENNGTVNNAIFNVSGGFDGKGAYEFNGINSSINITASSSLNLSQSDHTISLWFKASSKQSNSFNHLIEKDNATFFRGYVVFIRDTGLVALHYRGNNSDGTNFTTVSKHDGPYNDSQWHHLVYTVNVNNKSITMYVDNAIVNYTEYIGILRDDGDMFVIGARADLQNMYNGTIDDIQIYNASLSSQQIKAIYDNRTDIIVNDMLAGDDLWRASVTPNDGEGDGIPVLSNTLTVYGLNINLMSPTDNYRNNVVNQDFIFNTTAFSTTICSLYNNASGTWQNISSISTILRNANNTITHSSIPEANKIVWNILCRSPLGTEFRAASNFTLDIDRTNSILFFNSPVRANTTHYKTQMVNFNINASDYGGLFEVLINITNSTGQSVYENLSTNLSIVDYLFNNSINFSSNSTGRYQVNVQASDDHTAKEIKTYGYTRRISEMITEFQTETDLNVTIQAVYSDLRLDDISVERATDRYRFIYNWQPKSPVKDYTFIYHIESDKPLIYRNNSGYKGHFVTGNNWVDFEGVSGTYEIYQNNTGWYVKIVSSQTLHNFSSIGGLNIVEENVSFNYGYTNVSFKRPNTITNRSFVSNTQFINVTAEHVGNLFYQNVIYIDGGSKVVCGLRSWCDYSFNASDYSTYSKGVHNFNASALMLNDDYNVTDVIFFSNSDDYVVNSTVMSTKFAYENNYAYGTYPSGDSRELKYLHNGSVYFIDNSLENLTSIIYSFPTSRLTTDYDHRNINYDIFYVDGTSVNVTYQIFADNITMTVNRSMTTGYHTFEFYYSIYYGGASGDGGGDGGGGGGGAAGAAANVTEQRYRIHNESLTISEIQDLGAEIEKRYSFNMFIFGVYDEYEKGSDIDGEIFLFKVNESVKAGDMSVYILDKNNYTQKTVDVELQDDLYYTFNTNLNLGAGDYYLLVTSRIEGTTLYKYVPFKIVETKFVFSDWLFDKIEGLDLELYGLWTAFIAILILLLYIIYQLSKR